MAIFTIVEYRDAGWDRVCHIVASSPEEALKRLGVEVGGEHPWTTTSRQLNRWLHRWSHEIKLVDSVPLGETVDIWYYCDSDIESHSIDD